MKDKSFSFWWIASSNFSLFARLCWASAVTYIKKMMIFSLDFPAHWYEFYCLNLLVLHVPNTWNICSQTLNSLQNKLSTLNFQVSTLFCWGLHAFSKEFSMLLSSLGSTAEAIDDPILPLHTVLPPPLMVPEQKIRHFTTSIAFPIINYSYWFVANSRYNCAHGRE